MTRATARYIGFLAIAIIVFHWKTVLSDQFTSIIGYEGVGQTYAWLHLWVRSVWSGHLPLWDSNVFAGRPYTEEMAAFYPFHLLFAFVPFNHNGLLSPRLYQEFVAFNRFLGACFMFALMREFRRSHFASFVAACAFSMAGLVGRLPWLQYIESCIWLPAVFLFLLRALRSGQRRRALLEAALAGVCMGMSILSGGVQFAMIQGICILGALAYYGAVHSPSTGPACLRAHWGRLATVFGVINGTALAIGAAQLLPSFEFGRLSLRFITGGVNPTADKIHYSRLVPGMWPESILSSLFSGAQPFGGDEAWPHYIGVFPMFLAATAIWKCWSNPWVRFLSIMSVVAFLYTLGEFSPLFGILYAVVPLLWMARAAGRFVYLITFALAVLSAFGLDSLLDGAGNRALWVQARPFLKWIAIACTIAVIVPDLFGQITLGLWTCMSLLLIIASCAWFYRLTLRPAAASLRFMLVAFILFDLGAFNWGAQNKDELAKTGDSYVEMVSLQQATAFVNSRPGLNRVQVAIASLPNIGDIYGAQSLWGGGATILTGYSRISQHPELLNVRYRIKPASTPDPGAVWQDKLWKVYEDPAAFPRAWLVHQTIVLPSDDAVFGRIGTPGLDLHTTALVESPLPHPLDTAASGDSVRFRNYAAENMSLDVNAAGSGLLVLSEMNYPGWKATVNGRPAEILKTDGALRGILVPRGQSNVALSYAPFSFYAGIAISLLTAIGVFVFWILERRREPRPRPAV